MPSAALIRWQTDRMVRLGHTDTQCAALLAAPSPAIGGTGSGTPVTSTAIPSSGAGAHTASMTPIAEESLQGYVMLVSGHFQGFCRDLYSECAQACASAVPSTMLATVQLQFFSELQLNSRNPTHENIRKDYQRFGLSLDLAAADPANALRVTQLSHLNHWRNQAAHQKSTPLPTGVPAILTLNDIRTWRASCDGLASALDDIMNRELTRILGTAPW